MRSRNGRVHIVWSYVRALSRSPVATMDRRANPHCQPAEPPSQEVIDAAKAKARPNPRPKFGSPPKSEMGKP